MGYRAEADYLKCGPQTRSIDITWELVSTAGSQIPDLLNQNLHFNKTPGQFAYTSSVKTAGVKNGRGGAWALGGHGG